MRLLLVEDQPDLERMLTASLGREGILVDAAGTLAMAREAIETVSYDVVVLDRGLPDGDGLDLVQVLRQRQPGVPVLVLSAMNSVANRIDGLDMGADDYLTKPFVFDELLARIRAVMRRPSAVAAPVITLANVSFDQGSRTVGVAGEPIDLTRRELLVFEALVQRRGRTVTRGVLEEAVFGYDDEIASNSLDSHVSRLRSKLQKAGALVEIHALRGIG